MNVREAILWAYRLFLNRDPESDDVLAAGMASYASPDALREAIRTCAEAMLILDQAGTVFDPRYPVDWREGVLWAYRLLLRREPTEDEVRDQLVPDDTINALRLRLVTSREFEVGSPELKGLTAFAIANAFAPFPQRAPIDGVFQDIFGSRTKVEYLDRNWHVLSGYVYRSVPRHEEAGLHGTPEWIGTLRSILEAGDTFTAIELGAGWAPWLIVCDRAARKRGISRISLTGVEGSAEHHGFMLDNFRANGLDPERHELHHAVAGASDGVALFPRLRVATDDYGANAVFNDGESAAAATRGELEEIRSISLNTLLAGKDRVDLIHIDIQGHEETVVAAGIDALNRTTRRLVIGTHSRSIEGHLFDLLQQHGWICEFEVPCRLRPSLAGPLELDCDGEQVWRNGRVQTRDPR